MNKGYAIKTARRKMRRKYSRRKQFIIRGRSLMAAAIALFLVLQIFHPQDKGLSLPEGLTQWKQDVLSVISSSIGDEDDAPDLRYQTTLTGEDGTVSISRGSGEARDGALSENGSTEGDGENKSSKESTEAASGSLVSGTDSNNSDSEKKSLKVTALEKLAALAFPAARSDSSKTVTPKVENPTANTEDGNESGEDVSGSISGQTDSANETIVESTDPAPVNSQDPQVLIYHTHATEAYLPTAENNYHSVEEVDTVREVGTALASELNKRGLSTYQDKTLHDNPSYNKSYNRSLETAKTLLSTYPNSKMIIDLHRDAASSMGDNPKTAVVNGETIAAFSLVVGTGNANATQLKALAEEIMNTANEMYPGICRNVIDRPYKFNGYLSDNFILLEIGNNANTIEQAKAATPYIAEVISKVIA